MDTSSGGGSFGGIGDIFNSIGNIWGDYQGYKGSIQIGDLLNEGASFNQYRPQYAQQLSTLISNPSSITSTPGYQFGLDQAENQVQRRLGSEGLIGGGTMAQTMSDTAAGYAGSQLQNQELLLANLAGAQFNPATFAQAMTDNNQSKANSGSSMFGGVGNIIADVAGFFGL